MQERLKSYGKWLLEQTKELIDEYQKAGKLEYPYQDGALGAFQMHGHEFTQMFVSLADGKTSSPWGPDRKDEPEFPETSSPLSSLKKYLEYANDYASRFRESEWGALPKEWQDKMKALGAIRDKFLEFFPELQE